MTCSTPRRVLPHEYAKYCQHLKRLDLDSKILRFGCAINDEVIDQLCQTIEKNRDNHVLFCIENDNLEFVAVGHIVVGDTMELAFSVLKDYQNQGLGSALMRRCIQWCRTNNILEGEMVCLSTNQAIRHLCNKHGISMVNNAGETMATIHLAPADAGTYISEVINQNLGAIDWLSKRAVLPVFRPGRRSTVR
jgi:GNAT superfamily N-acetyltransferase